MESYKPVLSFGEDSAARYDDVPRGDEAERRGGWERSPFSAVSRLHVSVDGR